MKKLTILGLFLISLKSMGVGKVKTEDEFRTVVKRFNEFWQPRVKAEMGKDLIVEALWNEERANAHATRDREYNLVIKVNGGMARAQGMDEDGLVFILCHELGHHLGGAPKKKRGNTDIDSWSSAEGQADYFAANECLPEMFKGDDKKLSDVEIISPFCQEDEVCERILKTGVTIGNVFAILKNTDGPSIHHHSQVQVSETNLGHPDVQCRLDTIKNGALGEERPECWFRD